MLTFLVWICWKKIGPVLPVNIEINEEKMNKQMPIMKDLKPGKYTWCACGKTKTQPFCAGSHTKSDPQPIEFEIKEEKQVALCNCKLTKSPPYCDGAHEQLKKKVV